MEMRLCMRLSPERVIVMVRVELEKVGGKNINAKFSDLV